jgi:hypothetical protein
LREVGTRVTGPRSTFAKNLAQIKTATEEEVSGVTNMAAENRVKFDVHISYAETEATTWSIADTDRIVHQPKREIYSITSNEQICFKRQLSIRLIEFEASWKAIGIQELQKMIKQRGIHFGYPKMHLVSHISESIGQMGSGDNFTSDLSEQLHIANVKEAYRSTNKVIYIVLMLKHNGRCTGHDYMEQTLSHPSLQGWYDVGSAKVFTLLSHQQNGF